jgi:U32 family peptidase
MAARIRNADLADFSKKSSLSQAEESCYLQRDDMSHTDTAPELLSPAGNWDCARAAVANGADAIFFGLSRFNARLRADNFTEKDLPELMKFLHRHGVKGFVTMNTLIFPSEIEDAARQLLWLEACKVDAIIVQDLGLAKLAHTIAPKLALHASTQMTITSPEGLAFVESLFPLERAVLARELSVNELHRFSRATVETHAPLEVFVHGALCVAYSGQCLTSESLGQRSANRGECAQACRMPYDLIVDGIQQPLGEIRYLLSPQDLAAVDLIPDLVQAGVKSFKIEGRLKSPEYVAAVTRVYRKALDAAMAQKPAAISDHDRYSLEMTFSRGLSTGWLAGTNHPYLTHGKFGKKRGALLGEIIALGSGWIELAQTHPIPLQAGDGVVFDAGEDRNHEQGGRIWKIEGPRIYFHKTFSPLDWNRIRIGHQVWKTSDPKLETELRKAWQQAKLQPKKTPLHLIVTGAPGTLLTISGEGHSVTSAQPLGTAEKYPLTSATLEAQLSRLGDTDYELAHLDNLLAGDCHIAVSELNRLRRQLVQLLDEERAEPAPQITTVPDYSALLPQDSREPASESPRLACLCRTMEQLEAAIEAGADAMYCDFEDPRRYKDAVTLCPQVLVATPRILKPGEEGYLKLIERSGTHGILIRNLAALQYYKHSSLRQIGDFSLNVANHLTAQLLSEHSSLERMTISYDLNISQVLDLLTGTPPAWLELTLHQHMPMFHMEHCVFCTFLSTGTDYKNCGRPCETHVVHLRDRVGQLHRLSADVGCRNTLFNGRAQTGARFLPALLGAGLRYFRIELLAESRDESLQTLSLYRELLAGRCTPAALQQELEVTEKLGVTEGTLRE